MPQRTPSRCRRTCGHHHEIHLGTLRWWTVCRPVKTSTTYGDQGNHEDGLHSHRQQGAGSVRAPGQADEPGGHAGTERCPVYFACTGHVTSQQEDGKSVTATDAMKLVELPATPADQGPVLHHDEDDNGRHKGSRAGLVPLRVRLEEGWRIRPPLMCPSPFSFQTPPGKG